MTVVIEKLREGCLGEADGQDTDVLVIRSLGKKPTDRLVRKTVTEGRYSQNTEEREPVDEEDERQTTTTTKKPKTKPTTSTPTPTETESDEEHVNVVAGDNQDATM